MPQVWQQEAQFLVVLRGDLLAHLFKRRPWAERVVAIAQNASAFDLQFLLNSLFKMKLKGAEMQPRGECLSSEEE
jgi:hypothetical protein